MKYVYIFVFFAFCFIGSFTLKAQITQKTNTQSLIYPIIISQFGDTLSNAWAGGLNNCQFGELFLNDDSLIDLIVFDRHGNKITPFINSGYVNKNPYLAAPEYASKFPVLHDWVQFIDFNKDGKNDIFTYGYGAISVYQNTSSLENGLSFKLITPSLNSKQNNQFINLYVSDVDYPAILDMDNDGDLDILTFFGLGSFVDYHKNLSIEEFGHADSLVYVLEKHGWGDFMEGVETNHILLDTSLKPKTKHAGSTFLITDLNNDHYKDLIIGDYGYQTIMALYANESKITHIDSNLISPTTLPVFPVFSQLDINNDAIKELLVSSFNPSYTYYQNNSSAFMLNDDYSIKMLDKHFLTNTMLDVGNGANPILFDWDKDGLKDLFISAGCMKDSSICKSAVYYYKNIGTSNFSIFKFITNDFAKLSLLNKQFIYISFADINNDTNVDLIIGNLDGTLNFMQNSNGDFILNANALKDIDVGAYSTPYLYDITSDGNADLFIGNKDGTIDFYENSTSNGHVEFTLVSKYLNEINVTDTNKSVYGYSAPSICSYKNKPTLAIGSESGKIFLYDLDYSNNILKTTFISNSIFPNSGYRSSITSSDLNNDGLEDYIIGNFSGGCIYVNGSTSLTIPKIAIAQSALCEAYPNPISDKLVLSFKTKFKNASMKLITLEGAKLLDIPLENNKTEIDFSSIKSGMYFLEITYLSLNKNYKQIQKIIVLK